MKLSQSKKSDLHIVKKSTKKSNRKATAEKERYDGTAQIVPVAKDNPRRKGTFGWKSWNKIRKGMTVEQFVARGGRLKDLHWDVNHGHLKLLPAGRKAA